jgi:thiamine-phosphate pyrophosphorylase
MMDSHRSVTQSHPVLCYVTDRTALKATGAQALIAKIHLAIESGVDWIQIREKDLPARELLTLTRGAVRMAKDASERTRIIVNDRLDVAVATGAAGVHLGRESVALPDVVRWCRAGNAPPGFLIGASCHQIEEALEAERCGASYIFFGPVYDTPSKRPFGPPQGIERLRRVCEAVRIPVIAIGGITEDKAAEVMGAGAGGIAAIRLFQESKDAASLKQSVAGLHATSHGPVR